MKIKKWSSVSQSDARAMANCPLQMSNDYEEEWDNNPCAERRPFWMDPNYIPKEKLQSFLKEDTDTTQEDWCCKQVIMGNIFGIGTPNYTGWSIVVRTVIKWEERSRRKVVRVTNIVNHKPNRKTSDVKRWESKNGRIFRSRKRNNHINKIQGSKKGSS